MKNISKAFSGKLIIPMIQDRSTVHSEHQPLPDSITIISLKQFAIRISLFLHRLLNNIFKIYAFFLKEDFHLRWAARRHATWETSHATK